MVELLRPIVLGATKLAVAERILKSLVKPDFSLESFVLTVS